MTRLRAGGLSVVMIGLLAPLGRLHAQQSRIEPGPEPIAIDRLTGPITLDGIVDEPAWDEIDPLSMIMFAPTWGGSPSQKTEIRLAYDNRYLYMSGRLYEEDPSQIRLNTFYRDQFSGDDLLAIVVDSYNDYNTAVWFTTNPSGARTDRTMSNDAEFTAGVFPMNSDWNAHWDVETHRDDEGWSAEFKIPFSTLGFQSQDGKVTMGIIVYRFIARNNERQLFPAISQEWGGFGFAKPSQAQRMTLEDVAPSTPIYVTPYLLGGQSRLPVLQGPPAVASAGFHNEDDVTQEIGLDVKYSPTSNLSIDLTANTDFAQVEADDQQINLTRFPLFFPEKRQFFQERASTFDFGTGGATDRLFFSRRIGLADGDLVRIYGGARVVGRAGGMDFGVLNMQTASHGDRSGENVSVARIKQQVFNPYSSIGGMVVTRVGGNGQDNLAYGLDSDVRLFGDEYLTLKWAQTFDEEIDEGSALDAGLIQAAWQRRRTQGLSYSARYRRVGPDYLPRLGFQLRSDFSQYGGNLSYGWFPGRRSAFRSLTLSGRTSHYYRNVDNTPESRSFKPELRLEWKAGTTLTLGSTSSFESVRKPFSIAGLTIDDGEYWFHEANAQLMLSRSRLLRGDIRVSAGSFYDGTRQSVAVNPTWNVSKYLELGGGYEVNWLDFADRDMSTTTQLGRLRARFALDTHLSVNTFAQYNSLIDQTSINARFRYNFAEGTDLWVVYNQGFNLERGNGTDPRLPFSAGRTLMVKYSRTLTF